MLCTDLSQCSVLRSTCLLFILSLDCDTSRIRLYLTFHICPLPKCVICKSAAWWSSSYLHLCLLGLESGYPKIKERLQPIPFLHLICWLLHFIVSLTRAPFTRSRFKVPLDTIFILLHNDYIHKWKQYLQCYLRRTCKHYQKSARKYQPRQAADEAHPCLLRRTQMERYKGSTDAQCPETHWPYSSKSAGASLEGSDFSNINFPRIQCFIPPFWITVLYRHIRASWNIHNLLQQ